MGEVIAARILSSFDMEKKEKKSKRAYYNSLKERLESTKCELNRAIDVFNNITDPKLIDVYIYKITMEQKRYDQILSEIKEI